MLITIALLLGTSVIMLYLSRNIIFETRMAAHQVRSIVAFETADGGMDWITGALNSPYGIGPQCVPQSGELSLRRRYLHANWNSTAGNSTDINAMSTATPGCKLAATGLWSCMCPDSAEATASGLSTGPNAATDLPGFTVSISNVADPEAVRIVVTACSGSNGPCTAATAAGADATASISADLKMRPLVRLIPTAPLSCGLTCSLGLADHLSNQDLLTGGLTVDAGGNVYSDPSTTYRSLPGAPAGGTAREWSPALRAAANDDPTCSKSLVFARYFGTTVDTFSTTATTLTLAGCDESGSCDAKFEQAYTDGWRSYYFPDGYTRMSTFPMGSHADPVLLVSGASFSVRHSSAISGLVFVNSSELNGIGPGQVKVNGALLHCGHFKSNGPTSIHYAPDILGRLRRSTSVMARIPGSWTDRCTNNPAHPLEMRCQ